MNKTNLAFYEFVLNKWCNLSTYLDPDLDPHFEFGSWSSNSLNNDRDQKPCPWHISTTVIQGVGAREKIFIGERMENISVDRLKPISEVPPPPPRGCPSLLARGVVAAASGHPWLLLGGDSCGGHGIVIFIVYIYPQVSCRKYVNLYICPEKVFVGLFSQSVVSLNRECIHIPDN